MKIKKTLFSTSIEISVKEIEEMQLSPFHFMFKEYILVISKFFKNINK